MARMTPICITTALIAMTSAASAQFTGDYAGDTWTIQASIGGSAAFTTDGSSLTIVGPDELMYSDIDVSHVVTSDGIWSFTWSYTSLDSSPGYDSCYYLLNGTAYFLADTIIGAPPIVGRVTIDVQQGDVIGWRVQSTDGIFGPGTMVITDFQIPAPGALLLLGLAGLCHTRRRHD